ncbi:MAG: VCBS repeat-containing protein [Planctomycetes bacterium]|nr:VCBS repeat-containing protein [Planctomycetota bacterium]
MSGTARLLGLVAATLVGLPGPAGPLHAGEVRFLVPLTIEGVRSPVTLATGDFNRDGKLDLVAAGGSGAVDVVLQDPASRASWTRSSLKVGLSVFMVRAADLDGDGYDEVVAADTAAAAYLVPNDRGAFATPVPLPQARASRWIALGDWDSDGSLDLASANHAEGTVAVFSGDGKGGLAFQRLYSNGDPHSVEGIDHDGDGDLDLLVGEGGQGIRAYEGKGDGTFVPRGLLRGLPPCWRFIFKADLDHDGKGDLVLTCEGGAPQDPAFHAVAGRSNGDGSFEVTMDVATADIAAAVSLDLDADGHEDLALVAADTNVLSVRPGKGDGAFLPEVPFGPTGDGPSSIAGADLDSDGRADVVSADTGASTLTVFWGREGEHFLAAGKLTKGGTGAASAIADLDGDAAPDLFLPGASPPRVDVFLKPGFRSSSTPSLTIATAAALRHLNVLDLDGDGVADLAGIHVASGTLHVALLDAAGSVAAQHALPAGGVPAGLAAGRLDEGGTPDLAVLGLASSAVAVFLGQGGGAFVAASPVPTLERPRNLALGDADLDGLTDLVVAAAGAIAVHGGTGGGAFAAPAVVLRSDPPRAFLDLALGDVSGDSLPDIVAAAPGTAAVLVLRGRGSRSFEEPASVEISSAPRSIALADLDRDGLLDIATVNVGRTASFVLNRGADGLEPPVYVPGALPPSLDHAVLDMNRDGALDLVLFTVGAAYVFDGLPPAPGAGLLRRGDADESGTAGITDAIALLRWLFLDGARPCEDAADADDDSRLGVTDAVVLLRWLFLGEPPPPAPGPLACGEDPTPDGLGGCAGPCR